MNLRQNLALVGVLWGLVLVACERPKQEDVGRTVSAASASLPADKAPTPSGSAAEPKPSALSQLEDGVKLLSNGAEPRKPLRYSFVKGHKHKLVLTQKNQIKVKIGEEQMPGTDVPPITTTIQWEVTDASQAFAQIAFKVLAASVEGSKSDPAVMQVNEMLAEFKAFHGRQRSDTRGSLLGFEMDQGEIANPQVAQMMEAIKQSVGQLISPLPDEAVGVGGMWQVVSHFDQFGVKLLQRAAYSVVQLDDKGVLTDIELEQTAPPGKIAPPGMPAGMTVELVSLASKGQGRTHIDFKNCVSTSDIAINLSMKMRIPEGPSVPPGGQLVEMEMVTSMKIAQAK